MTRNIKILIEKEIINLAEAQARREGRPLSDLIQDAIIDHLVPTVPKSKKRDEAYHLFCEQPFQLTKEQFDAILNEDREGL
ncbi:MAG: hypothetical protein U5R49_17960 [Deltaproteobacteria bacterium]|nr:hypothetical protein [Deltaproteobacteria bacterium]